MCRSLEESRNQLATAFMFWTVIIVVCYCESVFIAGALATCVYGLRPIHFLAAEQSKKKIHQEKRITVVKMLVLVACEFHNWKKKKHCFLCIHTAHEDYRPSVTSKKLLFFITQMLKNWICSKIYTKISSPFWIWNFHSTSWTTSKPTNHIENWPKL